MVDWSKITVEDMLNSMDKMVKADNEGRNVFDVVMFDADGNETGAYAVVVDGAKCSWTKGLSGEEGAVPFEVKKGGIETLKAMQIEGLDAAMRFMFDGSIYTTNPAGAQRWFKIFNLGEEAVNKAVEEILAGK